MKIPIPAFSLLFCGFILFISSCMWAPMLTTNWSENYALADNGGKSDDPAINDGKLDSIAFSSQKRPRYFIIQFGEPKKVRRIVIHNYNLFRFEAQYWDNKRMEWKTFHTVRQRRDVETIQSKTVQPKYEIGRINFTTDKIRINVTRTVDDDVLSKKTLDKDDIVINRIRRYIAGRFVEYYRVLDEKAAGLREVEVYGLAENP